MIDDCELDVVLRTKNDEVAAGLVVDIDVEVEQIPLPYSPPNTLPVSCLFRSSLATLSCSHSFNDLMAFRMISAFVLMQCPTSCPGICAR